MWLSILFCIDNLYFFHTLFFVSHIFSTNPVPLHFFIIVCSSGGLQVSFTTHRIIFCRFACPPMEIIIYIQYFCKKKFCGTNRLKMSTLNSTFFHVFIVLPFCTIRSLFYCIFSLLGNAIVRLPLLPASHAPYFRSYASCFTSSSNSSPAE